MFLEPAERVFLDAILPDSTAALHQSFAAAGLATLTRLATLNYPATLKDSELRAAARFATDLRAEASLAMTGHYHYDGHANHNLDALELA